MLGLSLLRIRGHLVAQVADRSAACHRVIGHVVVSLRLGLLDPPPHLQIFRLELFNLRLAPRHVFGRTLFTRLSRHLVGDVHVDMRLDLGETLLQLLIFPVDLRRLRRPPRP